MSLYSGVMRNAGFPGQVYNNQHTGEGFPRDGQRTVNKRQTTQEVEDEREGEGK